MKRWLCGLISVVVAVVVAAGLLAVPAGANAFCGQTWGSLTKQGGHGGGFLVGARAGEQACYDRLVFDIDGSGAGYRVEYVSQVLTQGRGLPLSLRGGAFLDVTFNAPANDPNGRITYNPVDPANAVNVAGFRTFRQVGFGGSFEGVTTFGLGVRARLPFRVFALAGPGSHSRLVVDVGHQW